MKHSSTVVTVMGQAIARRDATIRKIVDGMRLSGCDVVLDVGAGQLQRRAWFPDAHYLATDIRNLPGVAFSADARRLPFKDGAITVVLGLELLEHVDEPRAVLQEVARVLKSDGVAVLSVPATFPRHDDHDYWRFTPQGLKHLSDPLFAHNDVQTFGHTFETMAVMVSYYWQLASNRYLPSANRAIPWLERLGFWLDRRILWASDPNGLHTMSADLLLVASHSQIRNDRGPRTGEMSP